MGLAEEGTINRTRTEALRLRRGREMAHPPKTLQNRACYLLPMFFWAEIERLIGLNLLYVSCFV